MKEIQDQITSGLARPDRRWLVTLLALLAPVGTVKIKAKPTSGTNEIIKNGWISRCRKSGGLAAGGTPEQPGASIEDTAAGDFRLRRATRLAKSVGVPNFMAA